MMTMGQDQGAREGQGGFRLLQEDPSLEDKPCPAVKNFVASVLNKKDMRDQDVASSYRNLVQYRDSRRSPLLNLHGFQPILEEADVLGGLLSPPSSPSSPNPGRRQPEDAERLPNKLMEELCEDIGMKSGDQMDLDFVEFLMGQDTNDGASHSHSSLHTPQGVQRGENISAASSNISSSGSSATGGGGGSGGEWQGMPAQNGSSIPVSVAASGAATAQSSTSSSPVRKRIHLSMSEQNSPEQQQQQQQPQEQKQKQQYHQQSRPYHHQQVHSPMCLPGQDFKLPLTPASQDTGQPDLSSAAVTKGLESVVSVSDAACGAGGSAKSLVSNMQQNMPGSFSPRHPASLTEETGSDSGGVDGQVQPVPYKNSGPCARGYSQASHTPHSVPLDHAEHRGSGQGHGTGGVAHAHHRSHHHHSQHDQRDYRQHQHQQTLPDVLTNYVGASFHQQQHHQGGKRHLYHKPPSKQPAAMGVGSGAHVTWKFPPASPVHQQQQQQLQQQQYLQHPSVQKAVLVTGVLNEDSITSCAVSASQPSSTTSTVMKPHMFQCGAGTKTVPKSHILPSGARDETLLNSHPFQSSVPNHGPSSSESSHTRTHNPLGVRDSQQPDTYYSQHPRQSASAAGNNRTQMNKESGTNFQPDSPAVIADLSASHSSGFVSHSSCQFPARSSGSDVVVNSNSSDIRPSCSYASSSVLNRVGKSCENRGSTANRTQGHGGLSMLPKTADRTGNSSVHGGSYINAHHKASHGSTVNTLHSNTSMSAPDMSGCLYAASVNPNLPVNPMRAAVQQQGLVSGDCGHLSQQSEQQWGKQGYASHPSASGLQQEADYMTAGSSHSQQQGPRNSVQQEAFNPFQLTAQSDLGLKATMNRQQDAGPRPSSVNDSSMNAGHDMNVSVNAGQGINMSMTSQDLNMSLGNKPDHRVMTPHQGMSSVPPPASPVGFQPSAVSTPVCNRARTPSHGHRTSMQEQSVGGSYPEGSGPGSRLYDPLKQAGGSYHAPWAGPSHLDPNHMPHPPQMTVSQGQQSSYPLDPGRLQFTPSSSQPLQYQRPSCSFPTKSPSPSSFTHSQPVPPPFPNPNTHQHLPHPHSQQHQSYHPGQKQDFASSHLQHAAHPQLQHSPHVSSQGQAFPQGAPFHPSGADGTLHNGPYPNSNHHAGPYSRAFSSRQKFIQSMIMDERNVAYRSHPLFPLLRDLVIAGMNFDNPSFRYQPLLSMLPRQFDRLLNNFLNRNPPAGDYQSNHAVESVLMDSLKLAHASIIEKISARQEQDRQRAIMSGSMQAVDDFCDQFGHASMGTGSGVVNGYPPPLNGQPPLHIMTPVGRHTKFMVTLNEGDVMGPVMLQMNDAGGMLGEPGNPFLCTTKQESKKHPSLPKEAVARMLDWLKTHKDNPYPNDDEKVQLIKQTGLTINQINYWFTNARRRILPKWSRQNEENSS